MRTPASIAGHPIHPMLVPIAIGGFILSFAFDLACWASGAASPNLWNQLAYYTMIGGILGALAAAVPGLVDLLSLPAGPIKNIALTHMAINLTVVAIYIVNAWMRQAYVSNRQPLNEMDNDRRRMTRRTGVPRGYNMLDIGIGRKVVGHRCVPDLRELARAGRR